MQTVLVNISAAGDVKVEAQGVRGAGCQQLTRAIEESLGRTMSDQKTAEFFQQQTANQSGTLGGGQQLNAGK